MNPDRLKKLEEYLETDPEDAFSKYAIALEYLEEQPLKAKVYFEQLLTDHDDYLPTYYHAAQLFADLELTTAAEKTYRNGLALAKQKGEIKALNELQNAYQNFQFEQS